MYSLRKRGRQPPLGLNGKEPTEYKLSKGEVLQRRTNQSHLKASRVEMGGDSRACTALSGRQVSSPPQMHQIRGEQLFCAEVNCGSVATCHKAWFIVFNVNFPEIFSIIMCFHLGPYNVSITRPRKWYHFPFFINEKREIQTCPAMVREWFPGGTSLSGRCCDCLASPGQPWSGSPHAPH